MDFYVSPTGNDLNTGTMAQPFLTIEKGLNACQTAHEPCVLTLQKGTYTCTNGYKLSNLSHPLKICGQEGECVTLSGSIPLANGVKQTQAIQAFSAPAQIPNHMPRQGFSSPCTPYDCELFSNARPLTTARYPKTGFIPIPTVIDEGAVPCEQLKKGVKDWQQGKGPTFEIQDAFLYQHANELNNASDLHASGYFKWGYAFDRIHIASVTQLKDGKTVRFQASEPSFFGMEGGEVEAKRVYFTGAHCFIQEDEDWTLDYKQKKVYIQTEQEGAHYELSVLDEPFFFLNESTDICIENLHFVRSRAHGIKMLHSSNITIRNCSFEYLGQKAVVLGEENKIALEDLESIRFGAQGGKNCLIENCVITGVGQGGVLLCGGNRDTLEKANNVVRQCDFTDFSRLVRTYTPAVELIGCGNRCEQNRLSHAPSMGIRFVGNEHVICQNEIFDVCNETSDVGAIYALRDWSQRGNIVRQNYIHDIITLGGYGSAAIYLDDMFASATVEQNLLVNIPGRALLLGGGRDNVFSNNIVINHGNGLGLHADNRAMGWAHKCAEAPDGYSYRTLISVPYRGELWSKRYPEILQLYPPQVDFKKGYEEASLPRGNHICNNQLYGVTLPFDSICDDVRKYGCVENNIAQDTPPANIYELVEKMLDPKNVGLSSAPLTPPCWSDTETVKETLKKISLSTDSVTLSVGETASFTYSVEPDEKNCALEGFVQEFEIADWDKDKTITGKRAGKTKLLLFTKDHLARASITIEVIDKKGE